MEGNIERVATEKKVGRGYEKECEGENNNGLRLKRMKDR